MTAQYRCAPPLIDAVPSVSAVSRRPPRPLTAPRAAHRRRQPNPANAAAPDARRARTGFARGVVARRSALGSAPRSVARRWTVQPPPRRPDRRVDSVGGAERERLGQACSGGCAGVWCWGRLPAHCLRSRRRADQAVASSAALDASGWVRPGAKGAQAAGVAVALGDCWHPGKVWVENRRPQPFDKSTSLATKRSTVAGRKLCAAPPRAGRSRSWHNGARPMDCAPRTRRRSRQAVTGSGLGRMSCAGALSGVCV